MASPTYDQSRPRKERLLSRGYTPKHCFWGKIHIQKIEMLQTVNKFVILSKKTSGKSPHLLHDAQLRRTT